MRLLSKVNNLVSPKFVQHVVVAAAVTLSLSKFIAATPPNILMIVVDDLNDYVGCLGGHPQVQTPNLDRLASRGTLFANAHCAAPLCNPSRAAIFSGLYPFETGVLANDERDIRKDRPDLVLLPQQFKRAGYHTLGTGKLLHQKGKGLFDVEFYPEQRWSPFSPKQVNYSGAELASKATDNPRHETVLKGTPIALPLNRMPSDRAPETNAGESFDWGPLPVADQEMGDSQIAAWAAEHLKQSHDQPILLAVGFYRPHIPLFAPQRYFDLYANLDIKLPLVHPNDLDDLSDTGRKWAIEAVSAGSHETVVRYHQWRAAVTAYLACISFVDAQIGILLHALENGPNASNTLVVFFSDHGWHLGEKQHWGKWTPWQRSTRVPLIIVPPQNDTEAHRGLICQAPVSLVDIYPTLLDICKLRSPGRLSGLSLVPQLVQPSSSSKRRVLTTFDANNYALTGERWKYIRYADESEELYDHQADPHEWHNLANDPQHASLKQELRQSLPQQSGSKKSNPRQGIPKKKST